MGGGGKQIHAALNGAARLNCVTSFSFFGHLFCGMDLGTHMGGRRDDDCGFVTA